jgi:hypothetical protein
LSGTPSTTTSSGSINTASGATLQFGGLGGGATYTFNSSSAFTGAGTFSVLGGSVTIQGSDAMTGAINVGGGALTMAPTSNLNPTTITVSGGSASFTTPNTPSVSGLTINGGAAIFNSPLNTTAFTLSAGSISGAGLVTLNGAGTWSGGTFGGNLDVASGQTLAINGGAKTFGAGTLVNDGTVTWSAGNIDILGNGSLTNNNQFNITGAVTAGDITYNGGSYTLALNNAATGTLAVTAGAGTATLGSFAYNGFGHGIKNVALTNTGSIDVQSGTSPSNPSRIPSA